MARSHYVCLSKEQKEILLREYERRRENGLSVSWSTLSSLLQSTLSLNSSPNQSTISRITRHSGVGEKKRGRKFSCDFREKELRDWVSKMFRKGISLTDLMIINKG